MRFWVLAAVSSLSAFAIFACAGSVLAQAAGRLASRLPRRSPGARARLLFHLRLLPAMLAVAGAFGIALPVFLWFEERDTTEPVNITLAVVAAIGIVLIARGVSRAARAWRTTATIADGWQRRARPVPGVAAPMPVFAIDERFPLMAVVGLVRPRLFVSECVLRECAPAEVSAMIAHECAHVSARDNVKRLLVRACPDVLGAPAELDRAWALAAEQAADAVAARSCPSARFDLAQALIRIARLASPVSPELASAFYLGGSIDARVRLLVDPPVEPPVSRWTRFVLPAAAVLAAAGVVLAAPSLHGAMELAVRILP